MLNVRDNTDGISRACVARNLEDIQRGTVTLDFSLLNRIPLTREIIVAMFRGDNDIPLAGVFLGPEGSINLRAWHYSYYPGPALYPGPNLYPKSNEDTYPSAKRFPGTKNYPNSNQPDSRTVLANSKGIVDLSIVINEPHNRNAEVSVYAERENGRGSHGFAGPLNWNFSNIRRVDVGAVYANKVAYDLSFDKLALNGDRPDPNWYFIRGYNGLRDSDRIRWVGAYDPSDPSTYSQPTELINLSRYDYARIYPGDPLVSTPKGVRWVMP